MKKYRFFIWGMALFLFACGNENTKNPVEEEILPFRAAYEMSSRDSSFFLPVFQCLVGGELICINEPDDWTDLCPPGMGVRVGELDLEHFTYVIGIVEIPSAAYVVEVDTLICKAGGYEYTLRCLYSGEDTLYRHVICKKYDKMYSNSVFSYSVLLEEGLGLKEDIRMEGNSTVLGYGECKLVRTRDELLDYVDEIEISKYPELQDFDFSTQSIILWHEYGSGEFCGVKTRLEPLSRTEYAYEAKMCFYGLTEEITDVCYASVLDKVPENVRVGMEVESVYEDY